MERAWPSAPAVLPRYGIRAVRDDGALYMNNSVGLYAIKKVFDSLTNGEAIKELPGNRVKAGRVVISFELPEDMGAVLRYKYRPDEAAWELPRNYQNMIEQFCERSITKSPVDGQTVIMEAIASSDGLYAARGQVARGVAAQPAARRAAEPLPKPKPKDEMAEKVAEITNGKDGKLDVKLLVAFAKRNDVWDDKYSALNNGLQRMNVVNRLRGKIAKGYKPKWR